MSEKLRSLQTPAVRAIRAHMAARAMTQNELAEALGVTPLRLSRAIAGQKGGLTAPLLQQIADQFDVEPLDLLRGHVDLYVGMDGTVITREYGKTAPAKRETRLPA